MAKRLLMGNEAFAHAALEAGVGVVAGYPGTPSTELIETVARQVAKGAARGVHVEWSTNEKAALEVAAAASMSGVRALFTCKQVGLNVASDALMSLNYVGVRGGLVLFVDDDPGPISSQTEQDTRRFAAFAKVPVLDPANPEQGFMMMKAAFDLSERYGTPVIVRPTTRISHASTFFDTVDRTQAREPLRRRDDAGEFLPEGADGFVRDPNRWVIFPKRSYEAHGEIHRRLAKIMHMFCYDEQLACFNPVFYNGRQVEGIMSDDAPASSATLGIVAGGVSASYALEALSMLSKESKRADYALPHFNFMQVGTAYPAPRRIFSRFFKGLSDVIVFEELDSVIEEDLLKVAGTSFLAPTIHGKLTGEASMRGENSTEEIALRIAEFFDKYGKRESYDGTTLESADGDTMPDSGLAARRNPRQSRKTYVGIAERILGPSAIFEYDGELPARPPVLCAGCPHRGAFYAAKNALEELGIPRDDAIFCGDIGCYTLGNAEPLDAVDTCLCMGAGITMAQGFAATNPNKKNLAFVGDSTFFASGLTGVANAVYNDHDITIFVLDNSTTAMTGMQPHPGIGKTLMGTQSEPIGIAGVLRALGVQAIHVADPLNRNAAEDAAVKALKTVGPSAVIFQSPCIWLKGSEKVAQVNVHKCTGCKKCIAEIGCPAVNFDKEARGAKSGKRGQACIDVPQCNGCSLCAQVCPFQAIRVLNRAEMEVEVNLASMVATGSTRPPAFSSISEDNEVEFVPEDETNDKIEDKPEDKIEDKPEVGVAAGEEGADGEMAQDDAQAKERAKSQSEGISEAAFDATLDALMGGSVFLDLKGDRE